MSEEQILNRIEPHFETIGYIYSDAIEWVNNIMNTFPETYYARTKATLLHNRVTSLAEEHFRDIPDVYSDTAYATLQLIFDKRVAMRFKKINRKTKLSSNIETGRIKRIRSGQYQLFSDNYEESVKLQCVEAGYIVNETWTDIEKIVIVLRTNTGMVWQYEISSANLIKNDTVKSESKEVSLPTTEKQIKIKE